LRADVQKSLEHQDAVVDLTFLLSFALVGKKIITEMHRVGEAVFEYTNWPAVGDPERDLDEGSVFYQVG
jgi:hypothetical protein